MPGDEVFVIGGYESGIDAAIGLARPGRRVTVLERGAAPWLDGDKDPSVERRGIRTPLLG
ncbi:NAD(P)-binding domain-containing protein [Paracoccus aminovorans]|uniref:NAD(P)-binding domain-containing protein n=1 Tax=Paracoccus aminovorans TaxID=34004 RepID=UPI000780BBD3